MHFTMTHILLLYLAFISLISVIATTADKSFAVHHTRRIPEKTLLALSALGGSAAMYVTMLLIRHKTRKSKFMAGIPLIMVIQVFIIIGIWYWLPVGR